MNTGTALALGIMVGVMVAAWFLTRKNRQQNEYDEMQLKIRAKGYRIGFFTVLMLLVVLILLLEMNVFTTVTPAFAAFAVLIAGVTVFAVYCIVHGAFLSFRGNAKNYLAIFAMVVALEGIATVRHLMNGDFLENGKLTFGSGCSAVMFAGFLVLLITLIVKTVRGGKETEE